MPETVMEAFARAPAPESGGGLRRLLDRLRGELLPGLAFGLLAVVGDEVEKLPYDVPLALGPDPHRLAERLQRGADQLGIALVEVLALILFSRGPAQLAARPMRFMAIALAAGTAALAGGRAAGWSNPVPVAEMPPWQDFLRDWGLAVMWSALCGWLFFLWLQGRADGRRLDALLDRRALLGRRVLQSDLGRARMQVDPQMIASVLRTVQARAQALPPPSAEPEAPPGEATQLLDRLADHLRLLLQRVRRETPTLAADLALLDSYVALHEAQHACPIALEVDPRLAAWGGQPAHACFLVARALLETVRAGGPMSGLRLALAPDGAALAIEAAFGAEAPEPARLAALDRSLARLQPGLAARIQPRPSGSRLVAHVRFLA